MGRDWDELHYLLSATRRNEPAAAEDKILDKAASAAKRTPGTTAAAAANVAEQSDRSARGTEGRVGTFGREECHPRSTAPLDEQVTQRVGPGLREGNLPPCVGPESLEMI